MSKKEFGVLVLTLRENELVQIGEDVILTMEKMSMRQAKFIIRAPKDILIKRLGKIGKTVTRLHHEGFNEEE